MYAVLFALVGVSTIGIARTQTASPLVPSEMPCDASIRQLLAKRVHAIAGPDDGIGIVVGIIEPHGRRIIAYGHSGGRDKARLTGDSVFEIGSVGKIFTALLLSEMVQRGEVALTDPVTKYLPTGTRLPEHNGHKISLGDLATHTSGLPFMPDAYPTVGDSHNYSPQDLYDYLARYELKRDPGAEWEYSNIDYWLLGEALARRAGLPFDELLQERIFRPLNMSSTVVKLPDQPRLKVAQGHDASLQPAPPFYALSVYRTLGAAAGGVYSSPSDLLNFLSVALGFKPSPLGPSIDAMLETRRPMDGDQQALGWIVEGKGRNEFFFHEGGTWGYASAVAWDPAKKVGVVVISNQQQSVADLARHLLRPELPLETPSLAKHAEIPIPAAALEAYAGRYVAEDVGDFNIIQDGDHLILQTPVDWGLPRFRLRPATKQEFFVAEMPMRVTFHADEKENITGALIYPPRGQHGIPATKITRRP